jgi:sulfur-oxidizing protein SoxY
MNRRKFLTLSVATALTLPIASWATDYRSEKPAAWTAKSVKDAVKALYGDVKLTKSNKVTLKMPKVSSNGGAVPVGISTDIDAKSVALFQNCNPESVVAVWSVPENGIVDYKVKLKIKTLKSGPSTVVVVVEGRDGNYYSTHATITVAGGCEG